jgi:hypothetical protein
MGEGDVGSTEPRSVSRVVELDADDEGERGVGIGHVLHLPGGVLGTYA